MQTLSVSVQLPYIYIYIYLLLLLLILSREGRGDVMYTTDLLLAQHEIKRVLFNSNIGRVFICYRGAV